MIVKAVFGDFDGTPVRSNEPSKANWNFAALPELRGELE